MRNRLYDRGILRQRRLSRPVVSIGNISVGGSGKTPFVIALGELLLGEGIAFDVLSRGYRREGTGTAVVDPAGTAREFGDEPLLIARRLGVPVIVSADRHAAGVLAEQRFDTRLHLLDDGFQHRRLARDFDIVLLTPADADDTLLPIGRLREPVAALRRAHAVVITPGTDESRFDLAGKHVWHAERGIEAGPLPEKPLAFCGIARPERFFSELHARGARPRAELAFRDHHRYEPRDVVQLRDLARMRGCDGFVTTEKDEVNLGPLGAELQPLSVVRANMRIAEQEQMLEALLSLMHR